jgi:hypothetical protein
MSSSSNTSIAKKARTKAEVDFATWLMMAKLGGFDDLPSNAQSFLASRPMSDGVPWPRKRSRENDDPPMHALMAASDRFNSRCGRFLYSALAETFRTFREIDFATWLGWLFDLLKSRPIAGRANNLSQSFTRSFHRDQSLKQNKN